MTPEQCQRMMEVCEKIQTETDQKGFIKLVYELNVLLEEAEQAFKRVRASNAVLGPKSVDGRIIEN